MIVVEEGAERWWEPEVGDVCIRTVLARHRRAAAHMDCDYTLQTRAKANQPMS